MNNRSPRRARRLAADTFWIAVGLSALLILAIIWPFRFGRRG